MKVGDYVRTDDCIGKVYDICHKEEDYYKFIIEKHGTLKICDSDYIVKSSPNIIDLIERFDLVNGHLVICKMYENEKDIPTIVKCVGDYYFKEEDIKSIVTKEQFSQMEYKVNKND